MSLTREERIAQIYEELELNRQARIRAMRSAAYSNNGVGVSYQRLEDLRKERDALEAELADLKGLNVGKRRFRQIRPRGF